MISRDESLARDRGCREPRADSHSGLSSSSRIRALAASVETTVPGTADCGSSGTSNVNGPDGTMPLSRSMAGCTRSTKP